jgi:uncharacterized protein
MPERTSYDPGTPSWIDLATPDPDAAKRFYGDLFGWTAEDAGPPEETGGYGFFFSGGTAVAGVGPRQSEDQPPAWSVFVATDDADAVAQRARDAGANVVVEPMDVMDAGRMVMLAPTPPGGMIGAWQAGRHTGAQLVNEPGGFAWHELHTRDLDGARAVGESVFGWEPREQEFDGATYTGGSVTIANRPTPSTARTSA